MMDHILIAYGSGSGSTAEVAEAIADVLRSPERGEPAEGGSEVLVDVKNVLDVSDLSPYSAAIIGSSIRAGRWLPEAVELVLHFRADLRRMPVAYFTTCLTMVNDTADSRRIVLGYMDPILDLDPDIRPVGLGLFAGSLDPHLQPILPGEGGPYGDFRDWKAIRSWAQLVRSRLVGDERPAGRRVEEMRGVILSFTDLSRANLDHVDLQEARLQASNLTKANLRESKLSWADLTDSRLEEADLSGASLIGSIMIRADCHHANLCGAILNGVQLQEANLSRADLSQADLNWANLTGADLSHADCRGVHLGWSILKDAKLTGCDLTGAVYNDQTQWPDGFDPAAAGCVKQGPLAQ